MTIKKLLKKYTDLLKQNYETVTISEVVKDLRLIESQNILRNAKRKGLI